MTAPTPAEIDAIRERRSKITPPPWYADNPDDDHAMNVLLVTTDRHGVGDLRTPFDEHGKVVAITMLQTPRFAGVADGRWCENTEFIANAPTDIDTLLAAIRERDATIERLTAAANRLLGAPIWGHQHWDSTMQSGVGCEICIESRRERDEFRKALRE